MEERATSDILCQCKTVLRSTIARTYIYYTLPRLFLNLIWDHRILLGCSVLYCTLVEVNYVLGLVVLSMQLATPRAENIVCVYAPLSPVTVITYVLYAFFESTHEICSTLFAAVHDFALVISTLQVILYLVQNVHVTVCMN